MNSTARSSLRTLALAGACGLVILAPGPIAAQESRVPLTAAMLRSSSELADFSGLVDEPGALPGSTNTPPKRGWEIPSQHWKQFPFSVTLDLGQDRTLSALWIFDTNGKGEWTLEAGEPGKWRPLLTNDCEHYLRWVKLPLDVNTRHLRLELKSPGANFAELALFEHTPEAWNALQAQRAAEARTRAERDTAMAAARAELTQRPQLDLPPFGRVALVDEVDCGLADPGHQFRESPAGASVMETILGRSCRVLRRTENEAAYMTFRIGRWKLLKPGAAYVLAVEYPEDEPRSVIILNGGNETSRGFHTGSTVGDALHAKYVNSNVESLRVPLSGRYETWTLGFNLHDRFPDLGFLRGPKERPLTGEDGFDVVVAQFSARNDPTSRGAAVARIRLYEVLDASALTQKLSLPPSPLPHRQIFWREEMADGVIEGEKESERGVKERLDWYRYKANQMRFLGINTYCKDLLEFGACQHWDPTPHGGNNWVHFSATKKDLWSQIVELMGAQGFGVLPYYEYSGSRGYQSLGYQRRCKPLTRDDAYTHITWVENANADLTDPDTHEDFRKMLDLTVVRLKDKARFKGAWLRSRWQMPMSFADATRDRFARKANGGKSVSRAELIADQGLLARYEHWWFGERRDFLAAMRDYLRTNGVPQATVLFTAEAGEPGTSFPVWEKRVVTDDIEGWQRILSSPEHLVDQKRPVAFGIDRVIGEKLYLDALLAAPLTWGNWEVNHASPPPDPAHYQNTPGVLMTHGFNRRYTVASPATFDLFRGPAGLALVRHYALNENMMFDPKDGEKLGYFVADMERSGPACMMAEALAVANGDPTMLGYLAGGNFGRGFPQYVREFNAHFLALPALPSERLTKACDDPEVAVRAIRTPQHGTWLAVVNTGYQDKRPVTIRLPQPGTAMDALTGLRLAGTAGAIELAMHPFELRAIRLTSPSPR